MTCPGLVFFRVILVCMGLTEHLGSVSGWLLLLNLEKLQPLFLQMFFCEPLLALALWVPDHTYVHAPETARLSDTLLISISVPFVLSFVFNSSNCYVFTFSNFLRSLPFIPSVYSSHTLVSTLKSSVLIFSLYLCVPRYLNMWTAAVITALTS